MTQHIALVGQMGAGKTSIANELVAHHGYTRVALADGVKDDLCSVLNIWLYNRRGGKPPYPVTREWIERNKPMLRPVLEWFETEWGRETISPTIWIDRLLDTVFDLSVPVVCDDCRFVNEAEALRRAGFVIVRVERDESDRIASVGDQGIAGHASETEQAAIRPDILVGNGAGISVAEAAEVIIHCLGNFAESVQRMREAA